MDKRFFLALLLTAIVVVATPLLFPGSARRPASPIVADSAAAGRTAIVRDSAAATAAIAAPAAPAAANSTTSALNPQVPVATAETTTVRARRTTYAFSSRGAAPVSVVLDSYPSRRPVAGKAGVARAADLATPRIPLARYRLLIGRDTVSLDDVALTADARAVNAAAPQLAYTGVAAGLPTTIAYQFVPDSFIVRVRATVAGAPAGSRLLVDLPRTLASNEADTLEDVRHLAVSYRARNEVSSVGFGKVDNGETRVENGPINWVATRNKYFLVAYRADPKAPFSSLQLTGQPRVEKLAPSMVATASLPLTNGSAGFDVYAGPQDSERLARLGSDLDQVNPYGGWLNGIVQPFATIVVKVLLWVKRTTQLNYGWVLVIFGIGIRLALWLPNQGALRTSMKMQRLQPELQAIQTRYKDDPKRQQEAIMKVYKDHGMSPLSPLMGCLPMLLPMPILFALYHVFQNTVEFRGVPFLWLPDISLADPYYIAPLLMGLSMFLMSSISMKGAPPNPQAKMMAYMMPVVLTVVFFKFASGLNLYYAVQNIAAIPQTWLIARERAKQAPVVMTPAVKGPSAAIKRRS